MNQTTNNTKKSPRTHSAYEFEFKREPSNLCGVTMSASIEGNIIADLMSKKPGVKVTKYPAIIRIDGEKMLECDMPDPLTPRLSFSML